MSIRKIYWIVCSVFLAVLVGAASLQTPSEYAKDDYQIACSAETRGYLHIELRENVSVRTPNEVSPEQCEHLRRIQGPIRIEYSSESGRVYFLEIGGRTVTPKTSRMDTIVVGALIILLTFFTVYRAIFPVAQEEM